MARSRKKFYRRIRLLLTLAGVVLASITYFDQEAKFAQIEAERISLTRQYAQLLNDTQRIERIISYSQTSDYAEQLAREQLGWVKPDDIKFVNKK